MPRTTSFAMSLDSVYADKAIADDRFGSHNWPTPVHVWPVFFKIDGSTTHVDALGKLVGTATVDGTEGVGPVIILQPGGSVTLPAEINQRTDQVTAIPLPPNQDRADVDGVFGFAVVLVQPEDLESDVLVAAHDALNASMQTALNDLIANLPNLAMNVGPGLIGAVVKSVTGAIKNAVHDAMGFWDTVDALVHRPAFGNSFAHFSQGSLPVAALVDATPWPCAVMVHLAAWSGLRAAELAGLQVGDVELPDAPINPNAPAKPGVLHVERTVITIDGALVYDTPKTKGSRRRVPLMSATTELLRGYLSDHPRRDDPAAPLFCSVTLTPAKPTGRRATDADGNRITPTAVDALAALSSDEAAQRLVLDWSATIRHQTFYKAVFRPAVLRANRLGGRDPMLPPALKFHALRHTYASLCVAAGIPPLQLSRFMGHAKLTTTLATYTHLFDDDHAETMAALEAMSRPSAPNVVPMRRRG